MSYDFSLGETQAFGGDLGYKELPNGVAVMVASDVNGDGPIRKICGHQIAVLRDICLPILILTDSLTTVIRTIYGISII
jgi:hypothetical protein